MKFLEKVDRRLAEIREDRLYLLYLLMLTAVVVAVLTILVVNLQHNFLLIACDTAEFQNAIVNTLDGRWYRDTAYDGPSVLGLHSVLALALVVPLYALIPSPSLLFILQLLGVYSAVVPFYLIALDLTRRPFLAFLLALATLASPMLIYLTVAPYHPETLITAAVLWSYYFYRRNRPGAFWIAVVFALTSGEQAAPIYIALGCSLLLADDGLAWRKRYGTWALVAGLIWMVFAVGILTPLNHVPGQQNLIAQHYAQWHAGTAGGLALAFAQDSGRVIGTLLNPFRWSHLFLFISAPLVLALLSRRSLLLLLPLPVFFLMDDQEFSLTFHAYYFQFAFFAGCIGLILFFSRWEVAGRLGGAVLVTVLFVNLVIDGITIARFGALSGGSSDTFSATLRQAFAGIPHEAGVYGPHRYSVYLSDRDNMVMGDMREEHVDFDAMVEKRYPLTNVHASQIDYLVCDVVNDQCGWREAEYDTNLSKIRLDNMNRLAKSDQWTVFFNNNGVIILKRQPAANHPPQGVEPRAVASPP